MLEDVTGILKCKREQFCLNSNVCFLLLIDNLMEHGKIATAPRAVVSSSCHSREILALCCLFFFFFLFFFFVFVVFFYLVTSKGNEKSAGNRNKGSPRI